MRKRNKVVADCNNLRNISEHRYGYDLFPFTKQLLMSFNVLILQRYECVFLPMQVRRSGAKFSSGSGQEQV